MTSLDPVLLGPIMITFFALWLGLMPLAFRERTTTKGQGTPRHADTSSSMSTHPAFARAAERPDNRSADRAA